MSRKSRCVRYRAVKLVSRYGRIRVHKSSRATEIGYGYRAGGRPDRQVLGGLDVVPKTASAFQGELRDAVCSAGRKTWRFCDGQDLTGRNALQFLNGSGRPFDSQHLHVGGLTETEMSDE